MIATDHEQAIARLNGLSQAAMQADRDHAAVTAEIVTVLYETQNVRGPWHDTAYAVMGRLAELGLLKRS